MAKNLIDNTNYGYDSNIGKEVFEGKVSAFNVNANNTTTPGVYMAFGGTNLPRNTTGLLIVANNDVGTSTGMRMQIFITGDGEVYTRTKSVGYDWSSWFKNLVPLE